METQTTTKNIVQLISKGGVVSILAFIVIYFGGQLLSSIQQMQKELSTIRVEIVKIQSTIITQEHVEKMIEEKIKILEYKYHSNSNLK